MTRYTAENGLVVVTGAAVPLAAAAGADLALHFLDGGALLATYGLMIAVMLLGLIYVSIQWNARLLASLSERLRHGMRREPFDPWLAGWLIGLASSGAGAAAYGRYAWGAALLDIGREHVAFGGLVAIVFGLLLLLQWIGAADQLARLRAFRETVINDPVSVALRDVQGQCARLKTMLDAEHERRAGVHQLVGDMDQLLSGFSSMLSRIEAERGQAPDAERQAIQRGDASQPRSMNARTLLSREESSL